MRRMRSFHERRRASNASGITATMKSMVSSVRLSAVMPTARPMYTALRTVGFRAKPYIV